MVAVDNPSESGVFEGKALEEDGLKMQTEEPDPKMNVIWGARAIGKVINVNQRQAFHLLETRAIPARKVGGQWTAEENQLREFWTEKDKSEATA